MGIRRILNSDYLFTALSYIKNFGELGIFFAEVIVESVFHDDDVVAVTFLGCQAIELCTVCTLVAIIDVVGLDER